MYSFRNETNTAFQQRKKVEKGKLTSRHSFIFLSIYLLISQSNYACPEAWAWWWMFKNQSGLNSTINMVGGKKNIQINSIIILKLLLPWHNCIYQSVYYSLFWPHRKKSLANAQPWALYHLHLWNLADALILSDLHKWKDITFYIYLFFFKYTTEHLRVKGLAQGSSSDSLAVLGFENTTFWWVVQC